MKIRTQEEKYNSSLNKANHLKYSGPHQTPRKNRKNLLLGLSVTFYFLCIILISLKIPLLWGLFITLMFVILSYAWYIIQPKIEKNKIFHLEIRGFEKIMGGKFFEEAEDQEIIHSYHRDEDIYEKNMPDYALQFGQIYNEEGHGKNRRVVDNFWLWKIIFPNTLSLHPFLFQKKKSKKETLFLKTITFLMLLFGFFLSLFLGFWWFCIYLALVGGIIFLLYKEKQKYIEYKNDFQILIPTGIGSYSKTIPEDLFPLISQIHEFYEEHSLPNTYEVFGDQNHIYIKDSREKKSFFKELHLYFLKKIEAGKENYFDTKLDIIMAFAEKIKPL